MAVEIKDIIEMVRKINNTYNGCVIYYISELNKEINQESSYEKVLDIIQKSDIIYRTDNGVFWCLECINKDGIKIILMPQ